MKLIIILSAFITINAFASEKSELRRLRISLENSIEAAEATKVKLQDFSDKQQSLSNKSMLSLGGFAFLLEMVAPPAGLLTRGAVWASRIVGTGTVIASIAELQTADSTIAYIQEAREDLDLADGRRINGDLQSYQQLFKRIDQISKRVAAVGASFVNSKAEKFDLLGITGCEHFVVSNQTLNFLIDAMKLKLERVKEIEANLL